MLAVEVPNLEHRQQAMKIVEATQIHCKLVRGAARIGKYLDAAVFAEPVFRGVGAELLEREIVLALQDTQVLRGHACVDDSFLRTDRAIALARCRDLPQHFVTYGAAMTTALMSLHHFRVPFCAYPDMTMDRIIA
jgi:hypothetical protein